MIGNIFNQWEIISEAGRDVKSNRLVSAKCSCGLVKTQRLDTIRDGISTRCQKCSFKNRTHYPSLVGKRFGLWDVISLAPTDKKQNIRYLCRCECGTEKEIPAYRLRKGNSSKCPHCRVKTHGMSYTSTFSIWRDILSRCNNPNIKAYKWYGARGIKVCHRWLKFENFLADMGERPDKLQIDRIDNNGNYEPSNCRWVTALVNSQNRRCSRKAD